MSGDSSEQENLISNVSEEEQTEKPKASLGHRILQGILDILLCRGDMSNGSLEKKPVSLKNMFRFASTGDAFCILAGTAFAVISGAIMPWICILEGLVVSVMLETKEPKGNDDFLKEFQFFTWLMLVQGTLSAITTFIQGYLLQRGCGNMVRTIRRVYLEAVLRQDPAFFAENNSGAITLNLNSNIQRIEDGLGDKLGQLTRGFSMFISSVFVCFYIDWHLTLISFMVGPLSAWTFGLMGKVTTKYTTRMMKTSTEAATVVEESVMNVKTVAACNAQEHMVEKYENVQKGYLSDSQKNYFWMGFFEGLTLFECYIMMGMVQWFGIRWFVSGILSDPGAVHLVGSTMSMTAYNLGTLGPHMMTILKARVAAAVIYETIDREPEIDPMDEGGIVLKEPKGNIELKNVQFRYPGRDSLVLKGISWKAESGEAVALVGQSGSGKSTSIGLLTRLHEAELGEVTIDGVPIQDINVRSLRKIIGIVEQEPCLFNGTVMENIILGREGISEEDAKKAATMAKADFIEHLQNGFDTVLGVGGVSLSGGQKQRIAIARAIATDPKILLLDEATSALDTESEKVVQAALNRAAEGRTTIIVAHRLSTLKDVDRIYVMDKGVVVEEGTHMELIDRGGMYYGMAKAQEIQCEEEERTQKTNTETSHRRLDSTQEPSENPKGLKKQETITQKEDYGSGMWKLLTHMKGNYLLFVIVMIVALIRSLEMPLSGVAMSYGFNALLPENRSETFTRSLWVLLIFSAIAVGSFLFQMAQFYLSGRLAEKVIARLRTRSLRSLLHRPPAQFDDPQSSPAACVSKFMQYPSSCLAALDYHFTNVLVSWFGILIGIGWSFFYSWQIGLYATGTCCILFAILVMNNFFANKARATSATKDHSAEHAVEMVEQTRTIQVLTVENYFMERYVEHQNRAIRYDRRIILIEAINFALAQSFVSFADVGVHFLAVWLVYSGTQNVGDVFFAIMCTVMANWSILYAAPFAADVVRSGHDAHGFFTIIDHEDTIEEAVESGETPVIRGAVNLKNVDFAYPTRPDVLVSKNLTIKAKEGENIALVGTSGSGKSTIINLLERFYTASAGKVLIDGHAVESLNLHHLRRHVALVSQEPVLFKGSILENITMGAGEVPMDEVVEACRTANALKFIEQFPARFETDVGERGKSLSGGQKQRIAIARALVRKPKVIMLDEATSALDTESEKVVQQALNDASVGRTSITIAHRLSSVQNCDRIYVIEKGSVVESGSHVSLMEKKGRYKKLVDAQKLNAA